MQLGSSRGVLQACRRRSIEVWSSGAPEARCGRVGVEEWERGSWGDALPVCRRGDVEVWSSGALEACRRCSDVEVWRSRGAAQACCLFASRDLELWRRGARCTDVDEFASRALEMRCRRVDVEMFVS